ncbi:MAG: GTP-binding protein [Thermomicrobiales bacterium]|nr:GTP-binding protein [Thermomicrobiales bacterium]
MQTEPIPATVLVGFLGSGKTTLLNELLSADNVEKTAVIVNDFSQINVDARLVRQASEHLVEMSNGCICCTLRQDLVDELAELSRVPDLQRVIIESTGIGEPLPIAQAFHMDELPELVRLEEIVTVVDSSRFWTDFERSDTIEDAEGNPVEAPLAPLLVDQLEYTNVILLNKADRATSAELDRLEGFVRGLNPVANIYRTVRCRLDPTLVRGTGLYDYEIGPDTEEWEEE